MSVAVVLPKLGFSMTEGKIVEWLVADGGDAVEGEPLFLLEADKATNEVEAPGSGRLSISVQQGETVDVGTIIAIIG